MDPLVVVLYAAHTFLGRGSWCKQRDKVDEDAILHVRVIVYSTGKGKVGPDKEVHVLVQFAVDARRTANPWATARGRDKHRSQQWDGRSFYSRSTSGRRWIAMPFRTPAILDQRPKRGSCPIPETTNLPEGAMESELTKPLTGRDPSASK